ncbi:carboxylesterase/lipase family protein [Streptodolium elevatio]
MIFETTHGRIQGTATGWGAVAKGIPFAASPTGELRFCPPQPPAAWPGVRAATQYGPASPQPHDPLLQEMFGLDGFATDEAGCLTLNVWTPAPAGAPATAATGSGDGAAARPVLVWLHGGAFITGSGSDPVFDGSRLAERRDVVVVTVNYRLGALGYLYLGDVLGPDYAQSGNLGLLDQIAALAWVRDNIAAFGGDPGNVTVAGQSAGAMSTLALMTAPAAAGLFHKAIVQSGNPEHVTTPDAATAVTRELLDVLGLDADSAAKLRDTPADELIRAQQVVQDAMMSRVAGVQLPFAPVVDGSTLPRPPLDALRDGAAKDISLIVGANLEEARLFLLLSGPQAADEEVLEPVFASRYTDPSQALAAFRAVEPDTSPGGLLNALISEQMFRAPTRLAAATHAVHTHQVWQYLLTWRSTAMNGHLGACHSVDLPFVFDNLHQPGAAVFTGPDAPQSLADAIGQAWASFAHTGDPGPAWPRYDDATGTTMIFDTQSAAAEDPLRHLDRLRSAPQP